jgi:hypothetical protein
MADQDNAEDDRHGNERELLIRYLRQEAYAVRDCFTRYSVQTTIATGGALIAIAKFQTEIPYLGLMALFPMILVFHIASMGIHKYGTSNRLLGYELHLHRTEHDVYADPCHEIMKTVGWEEAMRAWRSIEPNLWEEIYSPIGSFKKRLYPIRINDAVKAKIEARLGAGTDISGYWFDQKETSNRARVHYSAGGYLRTILIVFTFILMMCLLLMFVAICQLWILYGLGADAGKHNFVPGNRPIFLWSNWLATLIGILALVLTALRWRNIYSRIRILESGLWSIHSCGILWEAVVLAHLMALQELHYFDPYYGTGRTMHGYSRIVAERSKEIAAEAIDIHAWITNARNRLSVHVQEYLWFKNRAREVKQRESQRWIRRFRREKGLC